MWILDLYDLVDMEFGGKCFDFWVCWLLLVVSFFWLYCIVVMIYVVLSGCYVVDELWLLKNCWVGFWNWVGKEVMDDRMLRISLWWKNLIYIISGWEFLLRSSCLIIIVCLVLFCMRMILRLLVWWLISECCIWGFFKMGSVVGICSNC